MSEHDVESAKLDLLHALWGAGGSCCEDVVSAIEALIRAVIKEKTTHHIVFPSTEDDA